jgi:alpha-ketoglutarate-dependent taurine dioxygenase
MRSKESDASAVACHAGVLPRVVVAANGVTTAADACAWLARARGELEADLDVAGAVLLRELPLREASEFEAFARVLHPELADYAGGISPRTSVRGRIYASTYVPSRFTLPLHHELCYTDRYPSRLLFFCRVAPLRGGRTPIADSRSIYRDIDPAVRARFVEKGLRYERTLSGRAAAWDRVGSRRTWQATFETSDRASVAARCREQRMQAEWLADGSLRLATTRPAVIRHPRSGDPVWFNQAHVFSFLPRLQPGLLGRLLYRLASATGGLGYACRYGDGSPIAREDLEHVLDVIERHAVEFDWRRGDVLVLDNLRVAHGRTPYRGRREVLVAMA